MTVRRQPHAIGVLVAPEELAQIVEDAVKRALKEQGRGAPSTDAPYMSVASAARYAEVTPATIRRWMAAGKLTRCGGGRDFRIKRAELEALLNPEPSEDEDELTPEELADRDSFGH